MKEQKSGKVKNVKKVGKKLKKKNKKREKVKKIISGLRISKMVSKGQKGSQNVQYCLEWSSMVPNGPTWSKQNDHKFKRMAFINKKEYIASGQMELLR